MKRWDAAVLGMVALVAACSGGGEESTTTTAAAETSASTSTAAAASPTTASQVASTTIAPATNADFSFSTEGGGGGETVEVMIPAGKYVVTWTTEGELNFVVTPLKEDGEIFSLLINELGPSKGTVLLEVPVGKEIGSILIGTTTDNPAWTLTIESAAGD